MTRALLLAAALVPAAAASPVAASATTPRPVVINAEQAHLTAVGSLGSDRLATSVAIAGDTIVAGAPRADSAAGANTGSVYVYVRTGTTWTQQALLVADDAHDLDRFGSAVAISGETIVVGAPRADRAAGANTGSAYVYVRTGTTWTQQAQLIPGDAAARDQFGTSVAIAGDIAVVGVPSDDTGAGTNAGSVHVFTRTDGAWTPEAHLVALDAASGDHFGGAVAASGTTVVIGASRDDMVGRLDAGSAHVYDQADGAWALQAHLIAGDANAHQWFGNAVAIDRETIVIGAVNADLRAVNAGGAHVYVRTGTAWAEQAFLAANDARSGDGLGQSVSVSDDAVVIGASGDNVAGLVDAGSAYQFSRSRGAWTLRSHLFASDRGPTDNLGHAVALSGVTAVVGAPLDDLPSSGDAGSAHVFVPGGFITGSAVVTEGGAGDTTNAAVHIVLSAPYPIATSVEVHTEEGSATAYEDFTPVHQTVTFAPGQTIKTVLIPVLGDTTDEPDESVGLILANAVGAPIESAAGDVTIIDDD